MKFANFRSYALKSKKYPLWKWFSQGVGTFFTMTSLDFFYAFSYFLFRPLAEEERLRP